MKKLFMALMAVAAITLTSCEQNNNPNQPGNTPGGNDNSNETKTAAVAFIPAITADWMKLADIYVYDSIDDQTAKAETPTDLYILRTTKLDDLRQMVEVRTTQFENAQAFSGCFIKTNLTNKQKYGVRVELKLKSDYVDILKAMDQEEPIYLYGVMAYGMQSEDPNYYVTSINEGKTRASRILEAIEKNPEYLVDFAKLESRTMSATFTTNGSVISNSMLDY